MQPATVTSQYNQFRIFMKCKTLDIQCELRIIQPLLVGVLLHKVRNNETPNDITYLCSQLLNTATFG